MSQHNRYAWGAERGRRWLDYLPQLEAMLAPVDKPLLAALQLDQPYRIADIGSGGGATSRAAFEAAPSGSEVYGFDLSPDLVAHAKAGAPAGVAFTQADVAQAEIPAPPFDRLMSRFGVMFFDDPPAAFSRLRSWLAPEGRLAFAVWGPPGENPWFTTVCDAVGEVTELLPPEPDSPGPFRYGDPDSLPALLREAGFDQVEVRDWQGTLQLGGGFPASQAAEFALGAFSKFRDLLHGAGPEAVASAHHLLQARLAPFERAGTVELAAQVHLVVGR
ncbi:MAG: class I SAM-dependent methyltransferase [Myxococcota bacterium]